MLSDVVGPKVHFEGLADVNINASGKPGKRLFNMERLAKSDWVKF
jgi:hypothetical protein